MAFYDGLQCPRLPRGVKAMNPYADRQARACASAFLTKYFSDDRGRVLVLGINPGRFGAGITGVSFTDPVALADICGIPNHLPRRRELSSVFVYDFIERYGGPAAFYRDFFVTAASPLGFTRAGNNLNYYDERPLMNAVTPFITATLQHQIELGGRRDRAIVLGLGDNYRFLRALNEKHGLFSRMDALEHPRWIMQYRRKQIPAFIEKYEAVLRSALSA